MEALTRHISFTIFLMMVRSFTVVVQLAAHFSSQSMARGSMAPAVVTGNGMHLY